MSEYNPNHSPAPVAVAQHRIAFLDRDHSIFRFNERVLDWALRADVPLLERVSYLCIVSSNLDEFFEVRAEVTGALQPEAAVWRKTARRPR